MTGLPYTKSTLYRFLAQPLVQIAVLLVAGLYAYANTYQVPFLFDDIGVILDNPLLKNLHSLWPPAGTRWFGTVTFALNYAVGGVSVRGYHLTNLAIHLGAALLVYRFMLLTMQTPLFQESRQPSARHGVLPFAPFIAAYLFVAHPVQTQAVTYIVQRYTSLATLLYLAALVCYSQARLCYLRRNSGAARHVAAVFGWYCAVLLFMALAMQTKEIAFTLPFIVLLYEYIFFTGRPVSERALFYIPLLVTLLIIPRALSNAGFTSLSVISAAADISRHDYLLTQFPVIVTYLRLLLLPINQMVDYAYPVYHDFLTSSVLLPFSLLVLLLTASIALLWHGRWAGRAPLSCLAGFGGVWFFVTLSVESSIIPISDVIFEQRIYLPSVGIFCAVAVVGEMTVRLVAARFVRSAVFSLCIVVPLLVVLPVATHARNRVWHSGMSLWEDVLCKSPRHARAMVNIGIIHAERGNFDQGAYYFQEALRIKPDYADALVNLGNAYLDMGLLEESYGQYCKALLIGKLGNGRKAPVLMQIGNYHLKKHDADSAIRFYNQALALAPGMAIIHYNMGRALQEKGLPEEAGRAFAEAHRLNQDRY